MIFSEIFEQVASVAIGGHIRPDGDCVGSCLGLYLYLKQNYPWLQTDIYLEEIPEPFRFLKASNEIRHEISEQMGYDLFIALDCGDRERLGFSGGLFERAGRTICIDHHISNTGYADVNYIKPEASSTSELIYSICDKARISRDVAECLYLGMVHDTGVFQYSATAPSTMEAAADLMRKGIDAEGIIQKTYYEKTYNQNRVLGYTLLNSQLHLEGRVLTAVLTLADLAHFNVTAKELDGIASQLRNTKGVAAALFLYELGQGELKASLRSGNDIDVNSVAQHYGGGGHKKAAGFNIRQDAEALIADVLKQMERQLDGA